MTRIPTMALVWLWAGATVAGCNAPPAPGPALAAPEPTAAAGDATVVELFAAAGEPSLARAVDPTRLESLARDVAADSALWPVATFLVAEIRRARAEPDAAAASYRALVDWARGDPQADGLGGSSLATLALWRWLALTETTAATAPDAIDAALSAAEQLLPTRFARRLFSERMLSSLPQIEEGILHRAALLAWRTDRKPQATALFEKYLSLSTEPARSETDGAIFAHVVAGDAAATSRIELLRARRLDRLGRVEEALELARGVRKSGPPPARDEAGVLQAQLELKYDDRKRGVDRAGVIRLLDVVQREAADAAVAEQALYEKARVAGRAGPGQDRKQQERELRQLVERFPLGRYADDALLDLARIQQERGDLDDALGTFARLREFTGQNDYLHTASFQPAMTLYRRGQPGELEQALGILTGLKEQEPFGPYQRIATFWMARLSAELGRDEDAAALFRELVEQAPFDYYAIRARMHLHLGAAANVQLLADAETSRELREAFAASELEQSLPARTAYHQRLAQATESGIYRAALSAEEALRLPPRSQRLEDLSADDLARLDGFAHVGLLLAWRQDALAAGEAADGADRMALATAVGERGGDSTLRLILATGLGASTADPWSAERDGAFLATAYPVPYRDVLQRAGRDGGVRPELLYAVIRRESLLNPAAVSGSNAWGLFQFTPNTFAGLSRMGILPPEVPATFEQMALDPSHSIRTGAVWLEDLVKRQRRLSEAMGVAAGHEELYAVMEHNAGFRNVESWRRGLAEQDAMGDVEFAVDNIPAAQTRNFCRGIFTDVNVMLAAGSLSEM